MKYKLRSKHFLQTFKEIFFSIFLVSPVVGSLFIPFFNYSISLILPQIQFVYNSFFFAIKVHMKATTLLLTLYAHTHLAMFTRRYTGFNFLHGCTIYQLLRLLFLY